jgi:Sortilin, neurotensin receptor 3,
MFMFRFVIAFVVFALCSPFLQSQNISPVGAVSMRGMFKKMELERDIRTSQSPVVSTEIPWTNVGPFTKAQEGFIGGKAIPSYANGRGNGTGRIINMAFHPKHDQLVLAVSSTGGVFKSIDHGKSWTNTATDVLPQSGAACVAWHPKKKESWIIASGDGEGNWNPCDQVWMTTDGGQHYQAIAGSNPLTALPVLNGTNQNAENFFVRKLVIDPKNASKIWAVTNHGLWMCDQLNWQSWSMIPLNYDWKRMCDGDFFDLIFTKRGARWHGYIAGSKIYKSTDLGESWQPIAESGLQRGGLASWQRMTLHPHKHLPGFLYVNIVSSNIKDWSDAGSSKLFLLDLNQEIWNEIKFPKLEEIGACALRPRAFAVHPVDPNFLITCNVQPVYFSKDGGKTFLKSATNFMHDDVHALLFNSRGNEIWACHDGGISMSPDGGIHWNDRTEGLACANVFGLAVNPSGNGELLYGAYDTGINRLGAHHTHVIWGDGFDCAYALQGQEAYASIQDGLFYKSQDSIYFENGKLPNAKAEWKSNMAVHPLDDQMIWMAGKKLMRSLDGGESWQTAWQLSNDSTLLTAFDIFLSDFAKNVAIAYALDSKNVNKARLFYCNNANLTNENILSWFELPLLPSNGSVAKILFHPTAKNQFWVLMNDTNAAGKLWFFDGYAYRDVSANLGDARCESMIFDKSKFSMIIGSNRGVFVKSIHDELFTCYSGYPACSVKVLDIDYVNRELYIGTFGRGIWKCSLQALQ